MTSSFVSPRAVPQLADAEEVLRRVRRRPRVRYPVLVPNMRGMDRAERAGADAVAVFTAASEAFNERNIGMTIAESLEAFEPVLARARALGWWRRGYVSTAFGCPSTGAVDPPASWRSAPRSSTWGATRSRSATRSGSPSPTTCAGLRRAARADPGRALALHLHDTRGRALENVEAGLERGVIYDSSAGGTGGCPFAPGAPGNLATESLCGLLDRLGIRHGVDADAVRPQRARCART